jgi:glucan phosphoethanolaminetransferase (alkaline phosphatase superfamily)
VLSTSCAAVITALDSILLQLQREYFTGGFLAVDHVTSVSQGAAFMATSLAVDLAVIGAFTGLVLSGIFAVGWRNRAAVALAGTLAISPILFAMFVQYRLLTYLGDAFDLGLMFDLTGRRPSELVAVAGPHLVTLAIALGGIVAVLAALAWFGRRSQKRGDSTGNSRRAIPVNRRGATVAAATLLAAVLLVAGGVLSALVRSSSDVLDNGLRRKPTGQLLGAGVIAASDVDGDGFGMLGRPPDPDLFDSRVQPYGIDVPDSGVDENGIAGDLPRGNAYTETLPPLLTWPSRRDVVFIMLESVRADAVGAVVGGKPVTPVLDSLARTGVSVDKAYSHNGYTVASRYHTLSGNVAGLHAGTIIDDFSQNGYQTAYFSAQDDSFGGSRGLIGFEKADVAYDARADRDRRYTTFTTAGSLAVPYGVLTQRVGEFLDRRRSDRPLFLYVNFHDTHFPYYHRGIEPLVSNVIVPQGEISPAAADQLRQMYLNTAANVDRAIGELLERVRTVLGRDIGVVVLSDHGESLFDEGFLGHGYALNDAQTRIPLIVANLPFDVPEPFGQADLRAIIRQGMGSDRGAVPRVVRASGKRVFQYLGSIDRPAQIAFVTAAGRVTYDIRDRKFKGADGPWRSPELLSDRDRSQFLDLVHTWERMVMAKRQSVE